MQPSIPRRHHWGRRRKNPFRPNEIDPKSAVAIATAGTDAPITVKAAAAVVLTAAEGKVVAPAAKAKANPTAKAKAADAEARRRKRAELVALIEKYSRMHANRIKAGDANDEILLEKLAINEKALAELDKASAPDNSAELIADAAAAFF